MAVLFQTPTPWDMDLLQAQQLRTLLIIALRMVVSNSWTSPDLWSHKKLRTSQLSWIRNSHCVGRKILVLQIWLFTLLTAIPNWPWTQMVDLQVEEKILQLVKQPSITVWLCGYPGLFLDLCRYLQIDGLCICHNICQHYILYPV